MRAVSQFASAERMRRRVFLSLSCLVVGAASAVGCAGPQYFRPTERVDAVSEEGFEAASYPIVRENEMLGWGRVWSSGARAAGRDAARRTELHVGIELESASTRTLRLERPRLINARTASGVLPELEPASSFGDRTAAPFAVTHLDAYFALPDGVEPSDIRSFAIRWSVSSEDVRVHAETTPFVPGRRHRVWVPGCWWSSPWYHDPYWYPYWAWYPYPYPSVGIYGSYRVTGRPHRHVVVPRRR